MKIKTFASGSTGNLHLLNFNQSNVLIECGLPFSQIRKHLGPIIPDVCLLTHYHGDHSKSALKVMESGTNLYCTKPTADHLDLDHHRLRIIDREKWIELYDFRFIAFTTEHCAGSVCFLIDIDGERILFATDTQNLPYKFPGMTKIMIEANYLESKLDELTPVEQSQSIKHMGLLDTKKFLERNDLSRLKETHLIHLSDRNSDPELFKSEIQGITGAPVYIS